MIELICYIRLFNDYFEMNQNDKGVWLDSHKTVWPEKMFEFTTLDN